MAFNWLYGIMLLLLLVQSSTEVEPTVPYSGAVRSTPKIPKWWTRVNYSDRHNCWGSNDCPPGHCCIRPTGSSYNFCQAYRHESESCRVNQMMAEGVPGRRRVYSDLCPCAAGLVCSELGTGWVHAECTTLPSIKSTHETLRLRRSFRRAILQAVLNHQATKFKQMNHV